MELSLVVLHHHGEKSQERHKHILEKLCTKDFDIALLESRVVANAKLGANKFATLVADDLDPLGIAPGSPTLRKSRRSPPAQKIIRQIPKCRLPHGQAEHVIASQLYSNLFDGSSARRIVKIPVDWSNFSEQPSCSYGNNSPGPMFCIPLLNHDKVYLDRGRLKFHSLDEVLKLCRSSSVSVDPETRFLLLQLEEWLSERQSAQSRFLRLLFSRPASHLRLISCAHNPAHPYEVTSCIRKCQYRRRSFEDGPLPAEVCAANRIRNKMMELEKTDKFIMNPIHGSHLPYRVDSRSQVVKYQSRDRKRPVVYKVVSANTPSDGSDCDSLTDEYPLHKYAAQGNTEGIHKALKLGHDPDQLDRDLWAPIHYAAWYGHLGAVKALINYGRCSINLQNKNGSTPLHFATWWGHQYVVELLLCHPDLKPKLKDNDGKTPLEHCDAVPKPEWQNIAKLLRGAESEKLPKIQVDLMDGTNVMVTLVKGKDTTAAQLLQQMFVELQLPPESRLLFALWLCSEAIQLQLKSEHKPVVHMSTWRKKLIKLSDHPSPSTEDDRPRLELRRDAKLTLSLEKRVRKELVKLFDHPSPFTDYDRPRLELRRDAKLTLSLEKRVRKELVQLSDHPSPSTEDDRPRLELRRDAKLTLSLEKRLRKELVKLSDHPSPFTDYDRPRLELRRDAKLTLSLEKRVRKELVKLSDHPSPFTDYDRPRLELRRDAKLTLSLEKRVRKELVQLSDHPSPSTEDDRPRLELRRDAKLTLSLKKRVRKELVKLSDHPSPSTEDDRPRLELRRDAKLTLRVVIERTI